MLAVHRGPPMRPLPVALLSLALVLGAVALAPTASATPERPECGDVLGEAKCEQIREDVRDLLLCTCPPW